MSNDLCKLTPIKLTIWIDERGRWDVPDPV